MSSTCLPELAWSRPPDASAACPSRVKGEGPTTRGDLFRPVCRQVAEKSRERTRCRRALIHPTIRDYYQVSACKPPLRKHSDRIFRVLRPHRSIFSLFPFYVARGFFLLLPRFLPVYPPLRCSPPALLIKFLSTPFFRPRFDCPHTITLFCLYSPGSRYAVRYDPFSAVLMLFRLR